VRFYAKPRKFLKNPIKGQRAFLQAIEATSGLMQRFLVVENTYCITDKSSHLETSVVELYFRILVFQASALRHLDHRLTRTILSDTFNPSQWEHRLRKIREQEAECNKLLSDETRRQIESQSRNIRELRKKVEDSFSRQLVEIRVSLLPDRHNLWC
jgi:N-terminal domain of NWD NACHT-NTPase